MEILERLKAIKAFFKKYVIARKMMIFLSMVTAWIVLLAGALLSPQRQHYNAQQLETKQNFDNGTGEIDLVSQTYSEKNGILVLMFETHDQTSTIQKGIDPKNLRWNLYSKDKSAKTEMQILPIVDNKISVVLKNVPEHFEALAVDITNKTIDANDINVNLQNSESASDSKVEKEDTSIQFFITPNNKGLKKETLKNMSREEFAIKQLNAQLSLEKANMKQLQSSISKIETSIKDDENTLEGLESKSQYLVGDDKVSNDNDIKSVEGNIQQKETNIESAKQSIETVKARMEMMKKKKSDIEDGTFKFEAAIQTVEMK